MPHTNALARPAEAESSATLDDLRWEIDRIDHSLLALMERRLAAARAVALLKREDSGGRLNLRPAREAAVLGRVAGEAEAMPTGAVHAIWRELMAVNLQAQRRMEIALHAAAQPIVVADAARQRFGCAAPILIAGDAEGALERARGHEAVAVIELSPLSHWWVALHDDPDLVIFDALRDAAGAVVALAIGRIAPADLPGDLAYEILGEATLRRRVASGESIRTLAMCGHLRLAVRVGDGAVR